MNIYSFLQCLVVVVAVIGGLAVVKEVKSDTWQMKMIEYECRYNPVRVSAVSMYKSIHPCSRFIDQYRWSETQGMGFIPDGGAACFERSKVAGRELVCDGGKSPPSVPEKGSEFWGELSVDEYKSAVVNSNDFIPGERIDNYDPPRK